MNGWDLKIKKLDEMYDEKLKIDIVKIMKRIWGEKFLKNKKKKW